MRTGISSYLTALQLSHKDLMVIDSEAAELGYAIDSEKKGIVVVLGEGRMFGLTGTEAAAFGREILDIIEVHGIRRGGKKKA